MSESTTEQPHAEPTAPEVAPAEQHPQQDFNDLPQWARDSISKANKEAANYRTQVAELKPKAQQFQQLEEASKSEAQRLAEAVESARRDADTARSEAIRYKVAATHGLSADHFDLLGSGSEDEITARATKIAALIADQARLQATLAAPTSRPVESLKPGATPAEALNEDDALYAQLFPNNQ